jgi:hypothetical protein
MAHEWDRNSTAQTIKSQGAERPVGPSGSHGQSQAAEKAADRPRHAGTRGAFAH